MKGLMGGFYRISEWIMRFAVINLLWIICSIPFLYLFISFIIANIEIKHISEFLFLLAPAALIAPFTLFPATAAMFSVARKWVMDEEDVPLFKTFFSGYKSNYKQSMLGGLFFLFLGVVLAINFKFYGDMQGYLQLVSFVFVALSVVLLISLFNFFSIMVHFHMKFWQIMKNTILFSIGRPITSFLILVSNICILWISITKITFLIPFFMGSLIAYVSFWHFHRVFKKIQDKQEEENEAKGNSDSLSEEAKPQT